MRMAMANACTITGLRFKKFVEITLIRKFMITAILVYDHHAVSD